jgi:hypothetical protein
VIYIRTLGKFFGHTSFATAGDTITKMDLKELRRIDIEYGQKQDRDDRFKR